MPAADVIVTFHGVGPAGRVLDDAERGVWVDDVDTFRRMLDVVAEHPGVEVTVDDGNLSDVEVVLPELRARGLSATFFLLPGFFGRPGFVGEAESRALSDAGMAIGSHGMLHQTWRGLPTSRYGPEFVESRTILEQVCGRPVDVAACPFGAYDRRAVGMARTAGYQRLYTSDGGPARSTWLEPRNSVHADDTPQTLERVLLHRPSPPERAVRAAKRTVKRWR